MLRVASILIVSLTPLASGCVAAALPLAAGAVLVRQGSEKEARAKAAERETQVTAPTPDAATARVDAATEPLVTVTRLTTLPPPSPGASVQMGLLLALGPYVLGQAERPTTGPGRRMSALLARPGDLTSTRAECRAASSAVFIDLDPGRGTFDPLSPGRADAGLLEAIGTLRSRGIPIVWFSRLGENFDADVRTALATSGLDPDRRDQVVLMRTIDERKQTRREALADFLCPVALVGDERADFDELYLYLRKSDSALALEPLIGDGWFVVSPFHSQTDGAQP